MVNPSPSSTTREATKLSALSIAKCLSYAIIYFILVFARSIAAIIFNVFMFQWTLRCAKLSRTDMNNSLSLPVYWQFYAFLFSLYF